MAANHGVSYRQMSVFRQLWLFRDTIVTVTSPVLLLPLIFMNPSPVSKCAYGVLLMAVYWVTGAIPVEITALLPMVIFPLLSLVKAGDLSRHYLKDGTVLLIGGIMVALAIERWNLHKRIALKVLLFVGAKPRWLLLGFMLTSGVLSMWISNTATSTMMIPIAKAVMEEISRETTQYDEEADELVEQKGGVRVTAPNILRTEDTETNKKRVGGTVFGKGLVICIAYSSSIGGIATLTGTLPNVVLKGQADLLFKGEAGVNFISWFYFACPLSLVCLLLAWVWLQFYYLGWKQTLCVSQRQENSAERHDEAVRAMLQAEYDKLGNMTFAEWMVTAHFVCLVLLWLTREPGFCPGWGQLFNSRITDSLPALAVTFLLFVIPSAKPRPLASSSSVSGPQPPLMDWAAVQLNFPWSIVLLLGGGFALATACKVSGFSLWLALKLSTLEQIPLWVSSVIIAGVVSLATEISSNTAVASIFIPVMAEMGVAMGVNPMYFMLIATISSSFAFILPVATPPNSIAYSYGGLKFLDMAVPGAVLKLSCLAVLVLMINTWGQTYLRLDEYPLWAEHYKIALANQTISCG